MEDRMRTGTMVSAGAHAAILVVAAFGANWWPAPPPLPVTEIELIDGTQFDAAVSTAPIVPNKGPSELSPPAESADAAPDAPSGAAAPAKPAALAPLQAAEPPTPRPDRPELALPPPPTDVPTEAPRPSIAEIPNPDPLPTEAATPESVAATEPLQPLASAPSPQPAPKPAPPPEPEPSPDVVETPPPPPEQPKPDPSSVAEAQPEAPVAAAPQEARIPVARPSERTAASQAAQATRRPVTQPQPDATAKPDAPSEPATAEAPKPDAPKPAAQASTKPPRPAGGSSSAFAAQVTRGEKDALRLGLKQYFSYNGNRSDKSLRVTVLIRLNADYTLSGQPEVQATSGGDAGSQRAIFQAGRRAVIRAQQAGVFAKLPADKYEAWKEIIVTFTLEDIGFQS